MAETYDHLFTTDMPDRRAVGTPVATPFRPIAVAMSGTGHHRT